jgi:putative tricarboxylic transport membrane protein
LEFFDYLRLGFGISLTFSNLLYCFIGVTLGTAIGVLPGLGPVGTIAILLPVTFKMDLVSAIIMLAGIYYGAQYGGTITSVLVNVPGEGASVVTCFDGYPMAREGRAGVALGIAAFGSFIGGTIGIIGLSVVGVLLSRVALAVGPVEYSWLLILGLSLVIYLTSKSVTKGLMMAVMGLLLGTIGMDPVTGIDRFTFGTQTLVEGLNISHLAMGIFGIGELLYIAEREQYQSVLKPPSRLRELLPARKDWRDSAKPIARGTLLGFFLGCIPGGGAVVSSFLSYGVEKRVSKHPEKFGKGAIEGVAGPETANNSATAGAFVPLLTLGIPPNVVMALLIGAFMIHGVIPGPLFIQEHPDLFWGVVTSMYIGNIMLLILNIPLIGVFVQILRLRQQILSPLIILFCCIGAYSVNNNPVDVVIMMFFGVVGYVMRKFEFEPGPIMLAFVLGPMLEQAVRQAMIISHGSLMIFFTRPLSGVLCVATLVLYISPLFGVVARARRKSAITASED